MSKPHRAADFIKAKTNNFTPKVGIILGSGLGELADNIENPISIPYQDIPGYNACTVAGHNGTLHLGTIHDVPVVCMQGRAHYFEGRSKEDFHTLIRTLKLLGCESLLITNAAGSLREEVGPGEVVLINDHINFQPFNPMVGENDEEFGPRFFGMEDTYNPKLREMISTTAKRLNIPLHDGVYISVSGPSFETPAEIRAFRILGADVVGMSTVPEVIVARHCGLKVAVISAISNYAAGMTSQILSHDITLSGAALATEKLSRLVMGTLENYPNA